MPVCPNCGNQAAENAIFCDQCGTRLPVAEAEPAAATVVAEAEASAGSVPEGILICPNCGAENVPGEVFCDVCGEPLEAPEPIPSAALTAEPEAVVVEEEVVPEVELEPVLDAEPALEVETVLEVAEAEVEPAVPEPAPAGQAYCPVCGAAVHPGDTFCGTCGASLTLAAEEQSLVEEPVVAEVPEEAAAEEPGEAVPIEETVKETAVEEPVAVEAEVVEVPEADVTEAEEAIVEEVVEEAVVEEPVVVEVEAEPVEETVVEEPVVVEVEAEPAEAEELHCPVCGAIVLPEQRFCASCGAALPVAQAAPPEPPAVQPSATEAAIPVPEPAAPVTTGPYLEVADSRAHIPLIDQPELLIGRVDDVSGIYPDVDMTPHGGEEGGVSRRHALLVHEQDTWYVVDLDSTNGTYVNGAEIAPQVRVPLEDGDRIGLGDAELVLHLP